MTKITYNLEKDINSGAIEVYSSNSINWKYKTFDDLERAYDSGRYSIIHKNTEETFESFVQSISKQKVFDVEVEMMLQTRHGVEWYNLPNQNEGREPDGIYRRIPRIEKNSIKITKIN